MFYTKIGRLVHLQGKIKDDSVNSPSGDIKINVPFAPHNGNNNSESTTGSVLAYNTL